MKRYGMVLMAVVFVLALSVTAVAQYAAQESETAPSAAPSKMVMGTVVSVSMASLVIETVGGDRMTLTRDPDSMVPPTVTPGTTVHVEYDTPATGVLHVRKAEVAVGGSDMKMDDAANTAPAGGPAGRQTDTMPDTASPLPFIGFIGILALAGGITIRSAIHR